MTDEQINRAIAKACGWDYKPLNCGGADYSNSLDAMHEAEEVLDDQQLEKYTEMLMAWHGTNCGVRAKANQRAEAFLRALGEWEEVAS